MFSGFLSCPVFTLLRKGSYVYKEMYTKGSYVYKEMYTVKASAK